MFREGIHVMSNSTTTLSEEASPISSGIRVQDFGGLNSMLLNNPSNISAHHQSQKIKKKRNLPGNPDPDAEVIALSPKTLLATNRFVCEICNKGFQRDQNLQLHRRGHNLPWKLKQRNNKENRKRAYVCPEPTCLHHHPSRALGDLTGIKKHYCRKHGEKKWRCEKCSKVYAVQSDWKAHTKTCGTREYRCDCGTIFSRKDSFITHRAFCDALAEESARLSAAAASSSSIIFAPNHTTTQPPLLHFEPPSPPPHLLQHFSTHHHHFPAAQLDPPCTQLNNPINPINNNPLAHMMIKHEPYYHSIPIQLFQERSTMMMMSSPYETVHVSTTPPPPPLSATALLQKAATVGVMSHHDQSFAATTMAGFDDSMHNWQTSDRFTRDFLGLTGDHHHDGGSGNENVTGVFSPFPDYDRDRSMMLKNNQGFEFA